MAAYIFADIEITDPKGFEEYRQKVPAVIAAHGGKYLVRGGACEIVEGDWRPRRCVILEFPSLEKARAFIAAPDYAPLAALRQRTTNSRLVIIEGYAP